MNDFNELQKTQKNFLNGKISQFMDSYIRQHKVWTPEQMQVDFELKINEQIRTGYYLPDSEYPELHTTEIEHFLKIRLEGIKWLLTENGKKLSLNRFNKKYKKNKPIATRKSPIKERIRFGLKWNKDKFFDISFGLKDSFRFIETKELEKIEFLPWSIEHVNSELKEKYNSNILECLEKLSTSHLEKIFVDYWKKNYYSLKNPCIIPEVCGFRSNFYYCVFKDNIYSKKSEILEEDKSSTEYVNFRFDFLVINFEKQKIAFIELDGFENHKTRKQQTIDSIKRNNASQQNISLLTFTSKRIKENIESVFEELDNYLK